MSNPESLSIVIPCFNEEKRLSRTVTRICEFMNTLPFEVELVCVDDGSTDDTLHIIQQLREQVKQYPSIHLVSHGWSDNRGKGAAVREGLRQSKGKFCLICDADLSTPVDDLERLLAFRDQFPFVIGSRRAPGSEILTWQPWYRVVMGRVFSALSRNILAVPVNDFTCGFKLLTHELAGVLAEKMLMNRWGYDCEMLKIANVRNFGIKEVGVRWRHESGSKVRLKNDIFRSAYELMGIWWNDKMGRYRL